jgi:hypothetical protein
MITCYKDNLVITNFVSNSVILMQSVITNWVKKISSAIDSNELCNNELGYRNDSNKTSGLW